MSPHARPFGALALAVGTAALLVAPSVSAQYYTAPTPTPEAPWYDYIELRGFVDAYASVNYNFPKPQLGRNTLRAYDTANGFALSWVGVDASYAPDPVGATVSLRFGPTADAIGASCFSASTPCDSDVGLSLVKQAYVSWQPGGSGSAVTLDLGKFDTLYGAEVAEAQDNDNYTRGLVYWLAQPLFHTGLRLAYEVVPELTLKALVVNGYNNTIDNNLGKTLGAQAIFSPTESLSIALGWIGGPEQDDSLTVTCDPPNVPDPTGAPQCVPGGASESSELQVDRGGANEFDAWRHLVDLVVVYDPLPNLGFALNADYGVEGVRISNTTDAVESRRFYGAALSGRYALDDVWAAGLRGEYYADPDGHTTGVDDGRFVSGTLTIDATIAEYLMLRLDNRADVQLAGTPDAVFDRKLRDTSDTQFTTTLGVIASTP